MAEWLVFYPGADPMQSLMPARNSDGRLEVFAIDQNQNVWHTWQTAPSNGWIGTFVPAPAPGLGSNSNYFLSAQSPGFLGPMCNPLQSLTVSVGVTEEIVVKSSTGSTEGFTVQLNVWGPAAGPPPLVWQQYVIAL